MMASTTFISCQMKAMQLFGQVLQTLVIILSLHVLARGFPQGTVPFGSAHVPFGQYHRSQMCPLESCKSIDILVISLRA